MQCIAKALAFCSFWLALMSGFPVLLSGMKAPFRSTLYSQTQNTKSASVCSRAYLWAQNPHDTWSLPFAFFLPRIFLLVSKAVVSSMWPLSLRAVPFEGNCVKKKTGIWLWIEMSSTLWFLNDSPITIIIIIICIAAAPWSSSHGPGPCCARHFTDTEQKDNHYPKDLTV